MVQTVTETQDELAVGCCGSNFWSEEIMQQHLETQKLDFGKSGGNLDRGVETHPGCIGRAAEAWSTCSGKKTMKNN